MLDFLLLLAQTGGPTSQPGASTAEQFFKLWMPLILMVVVFYWIMFRGQSQERRKTQQMLDNLKPNDRVQTIGGLYGTIVTVRDRDVVLKIDENNNVKVRVNRAAVKEVLIETGETK